jgi:hypothetical protein
MARIDFIHLTAIHTSRRYRFFLCLMAIIDFSLPHGKNRFHSAYTAIHASWRYQFSLRLTVIINFSLPHGKNRFHPPDDDSCLTAISFFLRLTVIIDFSLPHGKN